MLVLRPDMTVPIARLVATRYAHAEPPFRFCYFAHAYRGVRPQRGQSRELLQAGVELIGSAAPEGTAEALTVLCKALDAAGLETYRVGLGDASLYPELLAALQIPEDARERILSALVDGDFVGVETRDHGARPAAGGCRRCSTASRRTRGGPEVLEEPLGTARGRSDGDARGARAARPAGGRADHLRPRAGAEPRLLHRRGLPGLRPRLRRPDRQRRTLRRAAGRIRPTRCRRSGSRSGSSGCTSR